MRDGDGSDKRVSVEEAEEAEAEEALEVVTNNTRHDIAVAQQVEDPVLESLTAIRDKVALDAERVNGGAGMAPVPAKSQPESRALALVPPPEDEVVVQATPPKRSKHAAPKGPKQPLSDATPSQNTIQPEHNGMLIIGNPAAWPYHSMSGGGGQLTAAYPAGLQSGGGNFWPVHIPFQYAMLVDVQRGHMLQRNAQEAEAAVIAELQQRAAAARRAAQEHMDLSAVHMYMMPPPQWPK